MKPAGPAPLRLLTLITEAKRSPYWAGYAPSSASTNATSFGSSSVPTVRLSACGICTPSTM